MTKYVLHIGLMKTGSTALQTALYDSRQSLRSQGILYPDSAIFQKKHAQLVWSCVPGELNAYAQSKYTGTSTEQYLEEIDREVTIAGAEYCIISCEDFSLFNPERYSQMIAGLAGDLMVVVVLRAQPQLLLSMYKQLVKGLGINDTLDEFAAKSLAIGKAGRTPLDFEELLRGWEAVVPREKIRVLLYDERAAVDIVSSFGNATGISFAHADGCARANESLDGDYLVFLRKVNEYLPIKFRPKFLSDLTELGTRHPSNYKVGLPASVTDMIVEQYKASNAAVARRYFSRDQLFS